jgi:hypothetical protein
VGQKNPTWPEIRKYLEKHGGFELRVKGGDVMIIGPDIADSRKKAIHTIGHKFNMSRTKPMAKGHMSALQRKFGLTRDSFNPKP